MERRRGDSYLGKEFSEPEGLPEDVHVKKNITCVDCHQTGTGGMGHIERKATCQDCHVEVEQAMATSLHKNLTCEACHVRILGGYEMTSWGPGMVASKPNPFKKYSLYYGPQEPPVLIKDQQGKWMPVKIWPNSVGGIKDPVQPKPGITFRWTNGETKDAFVQLGTFSAPRGNNLYLAWMQIEQVAHPLGRSRSCASCHAMEAQAARVAWKYLDTQGAEPFRGRQTVVADRQGLRIRDIAATSKITSLPGNSTLHYAAWLHLGDIWRTSGDFSVPKADPKKYASLERVLRQSSSRLGEIDRTLKTKEASGQNVKKQRKRWAEAKAVAAHDPFAVEFYLSEQRRTANRIE